MSEPPGQESLTIDPPPERWVELMAGSDRPAGDRRATHGAPRPLVIMTGHQAEFWHPGILAKYLAADAAARALTARGRPATVAWLVADQDSNDPSLIRYPAETGAGPARASWRLPFRGATTASDDLSNDTPTAALPPMEAEESALRGLQPALPSVAEGLARMAEVVRRHSRQTTAARQVTKATCDLLAPHTRPGSIIYASELYKLGIFSELLERMRADPAACTRAYNAAVARFPQARVRPLADEAGKLELPLWKMPQGPRLARTPVLARDLPDTEPAHLAPRALLMTALVRLGVCDLLIHGTGGGEYDQVTEAWMSAWLPGRPLAPMAVVTATRRLDFGVTPPSPEEITRARWRAHHARHDPAALGDAAAAGRKRDLLGRLRTARARGESPAVAFQQMHALLEETRRARQERLGEIQAAAVQAVEHRRLAEVVFERTWPFVLYPQRVIENLKAEVDAAFGVG